MSEGPSTPAPQPSTPEQQPSTPEQQPSTPEQQPSTPATQPSTDETPKTPQQKFEKREGPHDTIYIGKKPLMAYVTSTLIQLANQPTVTIKARGLSIGRAVDVSQITIKRMENAGYKIGDVRIGSETVKSEDGRTRNVSTIEIEIKKA